MLLSTAGPEKMQAEGPKKCNTLGITIFSLGVVTGTVMTIVVKVLYETESVGIDGVARVFEKPLFTTLTMTLAMACALPLHWLQQRNLPERERCPPFPRKLYLLMMIPAAFDTIGTVLAKIGLMYVTVSIFQLVRASLLIFVAVAKYFLGDVITKYMWVGIGINTVAMLLVGSTALLMPADAANKTGRQPYVGVLWILGSCALQGLQYVFEEKVMRIEGPPPLMVVGLEGCWGTLLMMPIMVAAYFLPGSDPRSGYPTGCVENVFDSVVMLQNSPLCCWMLAAFFFSVGGYNIFCVFVTHVLNSIWHSILDNFRPISVWGCDLLLFYCLSHRDYGEPWFSFSYLEVIGLMLMLLGTSVYSGKLRVPSWERRGDYDSLDADGEDEVAAPIGSRSPFLHSPVAGKQASDLAKAHQSPALARRRKQSEGALAEQGAPNYGSINAANPMAANLLPR